MAEQLTPRALAQVRLALLDDCGCNDTLAKAETYARNVGLTGAEIAAARSGSSFEAQTRLLVEYVCAAKTQDFAALHAIESRSRRLAVPKGLLDAVGRELLELQLI